jgi:ATP-dependent phosphoenolpyruvate carboxykinase
MAVLVGRPGTGKSTLAFADGSDAIACQEDRVAWMRDGSLVPAENAFFSPVRLAMGAATPIREALRAGSSHLENARQQGDALDLSDVTGSPPGRVVFGSCEAMQQTMRGERPPVVILLVRNQNVVPAVARLDGTAATAAYIAALEGQTVDEAGGIQTLRANPLFPLSAVAQGARLLELLMAHGPETYVLNTGRVGGPPEHAGSRDIEPRHSAAIVAALLAGAAEWEHEPTLGCDVAVRLPGFDPRDDDLLRPRALYRRQGRADEYASLTHRLTLRWAECAGRLADFSASLTV